MFLLEAIHCLFGSCICFILRWRFSCHISLVKFTLQELFFISRDLIMTSCLIENDSLFASSIHIALPAETIRISKASRIIAEIADSHVITHNLRKL